MAVSSILVATDGSRPSTDAVTFAVDLAAAHGATLRAVHVVRVVDAVTEWDTDEVVSSVPHEQTALDRAPLEQAADIARRAGILATTEILGGHPAREIVDDAEANDVDLIVVGSRGRGAIASAVIGSVSLAVLSMTERPVLVVRGALDHSEAPTFG